MLLIGPCNYTGVRFPSDTVAQRPLIEIGTLRRDLTQERYPLVTMGRVPMRHVPGILPSMRPFSCVAVTTSRGPGWATVRAVARSRAPPRMHHTSPRRRHRRVPSGRTTPGSTGAGNCGSLPPEVRIPVAQPSIGVYDACKGDRVTVEDVRDRCPAGRRAKLLSRVAMANIGPLHRRLFSLHVAAMPLMPAKAEASPKHEGPTLTMTECDIAFPNIDTEGGAVQTSVKYQVVHTRSKENGLCKGSNTN